MTSLIVLLAIGALIILVILLRNLMLSSEPPDIKPEASFKKKSFMTEAEKDFYSVLEKSAGLKYKVFAKPHLMDIIRVDTNNKPQWRTYFNRISAKHVDFLLCDPSTLEQVCVVELDDRSHYSQKTRERDQFVNEVLKEAGIPIAHIPVEREYSPGLILKEIAAAISGGKAPAAPAEPPKSHATLIPTEPPPLTKEERDRKYMPPEMRAELEEKEKPFTEANHAEL